MLATSLRISRRLSSSPRPSLASSIEKLSIPSYAPLTAATISSSFRMQALKLHPDTSPSSSSSSSSASSSSSSTSLTFAEAVEARDFLLEYIENPAPSSSDRRHPSNSPYNFRPRSSLDDYTDFADRIGTQLRDEQRRIKQQIRSNLRRATLSQRRGGEGSEELSGSAAAGELARASPLKPLTDALDRAYHGPKLGFQIDPEPDGTCNELWPCAFELDVRAGPEPAPLTGAEAVAPSSASVREIASCAGDARHLLEVVFARSLLGWVTHEREQEEVAASGAGLDGVFALHYCGALAMEARRYRVADFEDGGTANDYHYRTEVRTAAGAATAAAPSFVVKDDAGFRSSFFGFSNRKIAKKRRQVVVFDGAERELCSLVFFNSPGVEQIFVRSSISGDLITRLSRAKQLPKELWLWDERSQTHGVGGGWVVENMQRANKRHVMETEWDEPIDNWRAGGIEPGLLTLIIAQMSVAI
jgi:hypothetical protein